jgi:putative peptidoglycan binding protein
MGQDEVGKCVQGCPPSTPKQETEPEPPSSDLTHFVDFNFAVESGQPIADEAGFTLIHPDGSKEKGVLSDGKFTRDGVPEGFYRMKFKHIEECKWQRSTAVGEAKVVMSVKTKGFSDSPDVIFDVFRRFETRLEPRDTHKAPLHGNHACATFKFKQQVGESPDGEFVFQVTVGKKVAFSDVLTIQRHPLDRMAGVQQRLKELGFDPGPIDGIYGPLTKKAVRSFQENNPELVLDGIPGPLTKRELGKAL